jgi:DNA-binding NtrC family response regulator
MPPLPSGDGVFRYDTDMKDPVQDILAAIVRLAAADVTVLIHGADAVHNERAATILHHQSLRHSHPFVKVNCTAFDERHLESELFGHEPGAFPQAHTTRTGQFALAHRGTIFLDEIGALSLGTQRKVLRVVRAGAFEPLGSIRTSSVDVRILAATTRDLAQEVAQGRFDPEVYDRLNLIALNLPRLLRNTRDSRS